MATNAFYCSRCGKFTKHCRISARELSALSGDGFIIQALSTFSDYIGLTSLIDKVGNSGWKCMDCGRATVRSAKGEVLWVAKDS